MSTPRSSATIRGHRPRRDRGDTGLSGVQTTVIVAAALLVFLPLMLVPLLFLMGPLGLFGRGGGIAGLCLGAGQPSASGHAKDIPADYLRYYRKAGKKYGVPWNYLAGIGKEETNHGRSNLPGVHGGHNSAGAEGPMQFEPATWRKYGVDGDHDGKKDVYDPADAIFGAARMLKADGAPEHIWSAIFAYNHAAWYVADVLHYAEQYAAGDFGIADPDARAQAMCAGANAPLPAGAGKKIKAVIAYARDQLGKPYVWGATGPDAFDCSGLMVAAYEQIHVYLPRTSQAQWKKLPHVSKDQVQPGDLVFFAGSDGTTSDPGHVGLIIGHHKMIVAPHTGATVRIDSYQRSDLVGFARPLSWQPRRS